MTLQYAFVQSHISLNTNTFVHNFVFQNGDCWLHGPTTGMSQALSTIILVNTCKKYLKFSNTKNATAN